LEISTHTDKGRVRSNNEDSFLIVPPWSEPALSAGASLFAVADGMGGHAAGEVASRLAVNALERWLSNFREKEVSAALVESAFAEANSAIWEQVKLDSKLSGMGTTLTALLVSGKQAILGHVGDSRAYLLRNDSLEMLSTDHTLVAEQVRLGRLTPEAAKNHPARHILSRALGVREFITVDTSLIDIQPGDIMFLCSDGVTGMVSDKRLRERLQEGLLRKPFGGVGRSIVDDANEAGGVDNSTVVVIFFDEVPVEVPGRYSFRRLKKVLANWGCTSSW